VVSAVMFVSDSVCLSVGPQDSFLHVLRIFAATKRGIIMNDRLDDFGAILIIIIIIVIRMREFFSKDSSFI